MDIWCTFALAFGQTPGAENEFFERFEIRDREVVQEAVRIHLI